MRFSLMFLSKLTVAGALIVLLMLTGCQKEQTPAFDDEAFNRNIEALVKNPQADVTGRDFRTIPRYPKSQRIVYQKRQSGDRLTYLVAYQSQDNLNTVSSYYETEMKKNGWLLKAKEERILTMIFVRRELGGGFPLVQMMFRPTAKGTTVSIVVQDKDRK